MRNVRTTADDGAARARVTALLTELGLDEPLLVVNDRGLRLGVVEGVLADRVVDVAVTEAGRLRLLAELRGRRWAHERDVGVPEVLAAADDGRWLLSRRVRPVASGGRDWTTAAVQTAVRIAPLPPPPGEHWTPPSPGALDRVRGSVRDGARLVRAGVRMAELREVRAAARDLPHSEVTHGDYRAANAVVDEELARLVVLEWAGVRAGPRHLDLITLWTTTLDAEDRAHVAGVVLDRTAGWEGPDVGLLWHAVALEHVVARITRPDRGDGLDLDFARARLAEARRLAADLGSPVATGT